MLMTCPDCQLECTIDEESVDTANCPGCGLLLYSKSGRSGRPVLAARELTADELEQTRQWQAAIEDLLPTPAQLPRRLGRYELTQLLGEGSFAQVYLAFDSELGREVALKIPKKARFASAEHLKRFVDEARTSAKLEHPGIVRVYDIGWLSDDVCFISMEHCPNGSLDKLVKSGAVPHERAVQIVADVAEAIHFAHLKGFVHRDLKPSNIMFGSDGQPRIVDFGLALAEEQQVHLSGEIAGTLPYMSPEQVRGDTHHLDGRTDIWSLGILLYQLLVGRRPFAGNRQQLSEQILRREPKPLRQVDDSIPKELEEVCLKCLAKPVAERWTTAHDISAALNAWLNTRRSANIDLASPPLPVPAPRRWMTRGLLLGLLVLVVIPLAVFPAMILGPKPTSHDAGRELDPDWLNKQPALLAVPLLDRASKKLAWPIDSSRDSLDADTTEARLNINSAQMTLTELGETRAQVFRLDAQIFKTALVGASGLFWGFQMDSQNPRIGSCHAAYLLCRRASGGNTDYTVNLSYLKFQTMKSGNMSMITEEFRVDEAVDAPLASGSRLELWMDGSLRSISWNGRELTSLPKQFTQQEREYEKVRAPHDEKFPMIRSTGRFGIMNKGGSTMFRNAHFTLLKKPQP